MKIKHKYFSILEGEILFNNGIIIGYYFKGIALPFSFDYYKGQFTLRVLFFWLENKWKK